MIVRFRKNDPSGKLGVGTEAEENKQACCASGTGITDWPASRPRRFTARQIRLADLDICRGRLAALRTSQQYERLRRPFLVARMSNRVTNHSVCSIPHDCGVRVVDFSSSVRADKVWKFSREASLSKSNQAEYA